MNNSTNLKQIKGGRIIASGDVASVFSYELQDENFIKVVDSGDATLSLINRTDGNMYLNEIKSVTNGVITFTLPLLKNDSYSVSIKFNGSTYPSDDSVYIIILKNPDDAILNTVDPVTIATYLAEYAKKTEIPDTSLLALKSEVPTTTGLATELYVDEHIAAIPSVDLTGLATEAYVDDHIADSIGAITVDTTGLATELYVQDQISLIPSVDTTGLATEVYVDEKIAALPIQEPIDTSLFLTKPLSEPSLSTDPTTKNYVDNALLTVSGGGVSGESGTWTTIASGQYDLFQYNAYTYMVANGYKKFKVMLSVNSDATSFLLHLLHGNSQNHVSASSFNNTTKQTVKGITTNAAILIETGKALIELEYEFNGPAFLDLGDQNGRLKVTITTDSWGILNSYSTTTTSYSYTHNLNRLLPLNGGGTGGSSVKVDTFTNSTSKIVKGVFLGYK